jgi:hypothetical protein
MVSIVVGRLKDIPQSSSVNHCFFFFYKRFYLPRGTRVDTEIEYFHFAIYGSVAIIIPLLLVICTVASHIPGMPSYYLKASASKFESKSSCVCPFFYVLFFFFFCFYMFVHLSAYYSFFIFMLGLPSSQAFFIPPICIVLIVSVGLFISIYVGFKHLQHMLDEAFIASKKLKKDETLSELLPKFDNCHIEKVRVM